MRKIKTANHTIDIVFILVLFCLFAASVLSVLLAGANGYQGIVDKMEALLNRIEPTLVIIMSVMVGLILLSVMLPLMSIMSAIG